MSAACVRVGAPPKLNLGLAVLGKRSDGFHQLETTMVALAEGADELEIRGSQEPPPESLPGGPPFLSLELGGPLARPDVPRDERNLAVRAARALFPLACEALPRGLALRLTKAIPSGGGLGGGSADAAAVALALRLLAGHEETGPGGPVAAGAAPLEDRAVLQALGRLGSDCAFFFAARGTGLARCHGRGEIVEPLELDPELALRRWFCVLTPAFGCATPEVYGALDARPWTEASAPSNVLPDPRALFAEPLDVARGLLRNDLQEAALRSHPRLRILRSWLEDEGEEHFLLSGSGASLFGLFDDRDVASRVASRASAAFGPSDGAGVGPVSVLVTRAARRGLTPLSSK